MSSQHFKLFLRTIQLEYTLQQRGHTRTTVLMCEKQDTGNWK